MNSEYCICAKAQLSLLAGEIDSYVCMTFQCYVTKNATILHVL